MEYIEHTSLVQIYGLELAYPISLLTKFWFFKSTQHSNTLYAVGFGVCFGMDKKCSKMRSLYIPSLCQKHIGPLRF